MDHEAKQRLIETAAKARLNARAFSGFHVGAALLAKDGRVFTGCNVELHTTCESVCAERTALVKAVSEGCSDFEAIVVVSDAPHPISPCAFCRQYLADFDPTLPVIMANAAGTEIVEMTVTELYPMAFLGSGRDKNGNYSD